MVKRDFSTNATDLATALPRMLPRLWRFALYLVGAPEDAERLVENTCSQVLQVTSSARGPDDKLATALAIMCSIWLFDADVVRTPHRRLDESRELAPAARTSSATGVADTNIRLDDIVESVDALSDGERLIVLLVEVEGFCCDKVASMLHLPVKIVLARLAAARLSIGRRIVRSNASMPAHIDMESEKRFMGDAIGPTTASNSVQQC